MIEVDTLFEESIITLLEIIYTLEEPYQVLVATVSFCSKCGNLNNYYHFLP